MIKCPHCNKDIDEELSFIEEETEIIDNQAIVTQLMKCKECESFFNKILKSEDISFWYESIELL